ncbi:MAG TPA: class I SAM-dependent methyltransferase [Candidatus Paceibacterota bacterium]
MDYKEHQIKWTNEKVSRFWDYSSKNENATYFAQDVGENILELVGKHFVLKGDTLDYGCGNGFLIEYLLKKNIGNVNGCDFSVNSVDYVNSKFKDEKKFRGCIQLEQLPSEIKNNSFDNIFFLETIEHLLDEYFDITLYELNRILKKGGYIVLTTRNNENLKNLEVICPDCGGIFHRVQHVKSFTPQDIIQIMSDSGFKKVYCDVHNLGETSYNMVYYLKKIYHFINPLKTSHKSNLIYIGQKI